MLGTLDRLSRRQKQVLMGFADAAVLVAAVYGGVAMRLGTFTPDLTPYWPIMALAPVVGIPCFAFLGLYREIIRYVGPRIAILLAKGTLATTVVLIAASFLVINRGSGVSRAAFFGFACLTMIGCGGLRLAARSYLRSLSLTGREHVCIYGAGQAGAGLLAMLAADPTRAVAFIVDDDPRLQGRRIRGVPVHDPANLGELVARHRITTVMLAMPSIGVRRRREIIDVIRGLGRRVLTVPSLREIADGRARIDQLRPVAIEDLLGRSPIPPDPRLVAQTVSDRSVMVTGAGGSIGSELCRQALRQRPTRLIMVDSCEFNLYSIDAEITNSARRLGVAPVIESVLASVEDATRLEAVLRKHGVETLYHAAAYKHVPLVEANEIAGVRNNVIGTWRAAEAAEAAGVRTFVLISTDKAVRPSSVMGASKRFAELILQGFAFRGSPMRCINVRFGNVLGSSGSVIPLFRRQIEEGGPVTVTHPEVTRYFMTIPEASELVLQAASMGRGGEVFVLDMGEPVKIYDLARNMVELSGRTVRDDQRPDGDIEIIFTGLRPGEKLYEELVIGRDVDGTAHSQIMRSRDEHPGWEATLGLLHELEFAIDQQDVRAVRRTLEKAVPEYRQDKAARG
ncbi:MAG: polysaccharide biosynthesis protein [Phycisphaeraceae bacterium]|nr:polysaccharide biosynthesis protein [Phycisphaeraceae bacterium]